MGGRTCGPKIALKGSQPDPMRALIDLGRPLSALVLLSASSLLSMLAASPAEAANLAGCEAVIMGELEDGAAAIASFRDPTPFLASVYDGKVGLELEIDGQPIRGLMCTRRSPLPVASDVPIIASGVPFVLSTDFDSEDAPTVTIAIGEDGRATALMSAGLSERQEDELSTFLEGLPPLRFFEAPEPASGDGEESGDIGESDVDDTEGDGEAEE